MNFRIIDGDQNWMKLIPRFAELYQNRNIPVAKIKEQLHLNQNTYFKLLRECKENGLVTPRRQPNKKPDTYKKNPKYYSHTVIKNIEYYSVRRRINGKVGYYGNFKKARQAELMVQKLDECGWDKSQMQRLKREVLSECP